MKAPSPLLGFNNNVRHKGRVFHIQTEDSGVRHPHIITHLFADGGRILKTTKTSYAEHIGQDRLAETVRQMMQEQHKAMFIALRDGQFDYLFEEGGAPPQQGAATQQVKQAPPSAPAMPTTPIAAAAPPPAEPVKPPPPPSPPPPPRLPTPPAPPPAHEPTPASRRRPTSRPKLDVDPAMIHGTAANAEASIDLDLDALERAAAEAQTPFFQQIQDLPPPPAAVLGAKRGSPGSYSVRTTPPGTAAPVEPVQDGASVQDVRPVEPVTMGGDPPYPPARPVTMGGDPPARPVTMGGDPPARPVTTGGEPPARPAARTTPNPSPGGPPFFDSPRTATRRSSPRPAAQPVPVPASPARYAPSRPASIFATTRPQEGSSIFGEDLISEKSLDEVILSYLAEDLDSPGDKK